MIHAVDLANWDLPGIEEAFAHGNAAARRQGWKRKLKRNPRIK